MTTFGDRNMIAQLVATAHVNDIANDKLVGGTPSLRGECWRDGQVKDLSDFDNG